MNQAEGVSLSTVNQVDDGPPAQLASGPFRAVPDQARELVAELAALFCVDGSADGSIDCGARELRGRDEVRAVFDELRLAAKRQIRSYHCPPFANILPEDGEDAVGKKVLAAGVQIRIVSDTAVLGEPNGVRHLMNGAAAGWDVRLLTAVPMKLLISDDSVAMLGRADESSGIRTVLVRPSTLLDTLITGFETLWALAAPIEAGSTATELDGEITEIDRQCLLLLASGATDDTIARTLSMSLRTVQRRVTMLITRLGASSRFQAGVNAAKRGWL